MEKVVKRCWFCHQRLDAEFRGIDALYAQRHSEIEHEVKALVDKCRDQGERQSASYHFPAWQVTITYTVEPMQVSMAPLEKP